MSIFDFVGRPLIKTIHRFKLNCYLSLETFDVRCYKFNRGVSDKRDFTYFFEQSSLFFKYKNLLTSFEEKPDSEENGSGNFLHASIPSHSYFRFEADTVNWFSLIRFVLYRSIIIR